MTERVVAHGIGDITIRFDQKGLIAQILIARITLNNQNTTDFIRCAETSIVAAGKSGIFQATLIIGGCQFDFSSFLTSVAFVQRPLNWEVNSINTQSDLLRFHAVSFVLSTWYQTPRPFCDQLIFPLSGAGCLASQNPPEVLIGSVSNALLSFPLQFMQSGLHDRQITFVSSDISFNALLQIYELAFESNFSSFFYQTVH